MATGRPLEYGAHIIAKAKKYLSDLPNAEAVHTVEGLAIRLGTHRDTLYTWATIYPEFSDILNYLRTKKSFQLQNKALKKEVDSGIARLLLGHEGYREKQDITSDGAKLEGNTVILKRYDSEAGS